ncbi:hypothetical protein SLS53_005392 [Cytospora paraplurivora]|uniref:Zinc finger PHD-type domain-containing protein n=1 Tax=Cytospora paraplurivora TaxID=2898453 RepID=A0AAN9UE27_9PEZI
MLTSLPSFGDPNARPPTPPRKPPPAIFPSPLLATPKRNSGSFDEASARTPRFAEDYSVFNSTPGNLRGVSGNFGLDLSQLSPVPPSPGKRRSLSVESGAFEVATHANKCSRHREKFPTVDAARRVLPSADLLNNTDSGDFDSNVPPKVSRPQQSQGPAKRPRTSTSSVATTKGAGAQETQTATPPPSSRGGRKPALRIETDKMHNQGFGQQDFPNSQMPQQPQLNAAFVSESPENVFSYPMGPATTPPISGVRPFWGMNMDTSGMGIDVDLSTAGAELFQTTPTRRPSQQPMNSSDWGRANQMFQPTNLPAHLQPQQEQHQAPQQQPQGRNVQQGQYAKRERRIAPKTAQMSTSKADQSPQDSRYSFSSFQMSMDDPFSTSPGGVDPGLVFSQLSSSPLTADAMPMSTSMALDSSPPRPTSSASASIQQPITSMNVDTTVSRALMPTDDIRRAGSTGGRSQRKQLDRAPASISPTKNSAGRKGLSRSFSESARGGRRTVGGGRPALPTLAPARPATVHPPSLPPPVANHNSQPQSQGMRSGGRRSPLKSSQQHRLSSLSSIPENTANTQTRLRGATKASVKFVIDEHGRARAETVIDDDEPDLILPMSSRKNSHRNSWGGFPAAPEDDGYPSSSDDEPIILPSRATALNFPVPPNSSGSATAVPSIFAFGPRGSSQGRLRSNSDRQPSFSTTSFRQIPNIYPETTSMADHMDIDRSQHQPLRPSTGSSLGDAAAELRKVMQAGISKQPSAALQQQAIGSGGSSGHRQRFITTGQRSSSSTISEASLPTPSPTQSQNQGQLRCVCIRPEVEVDGAVFLVKCDSCEYLLHGRCVDLPSAQDVPHVYICAFCANTPNMRGGRTRFTGRNNSTEGLGVGIGDGLMGPPVSAASSEGSPLAHKSFRSFR